MKINLPEFLLIAKKPAHRTRHRERGSAVLVVLILLSVMLIYVKANLKVLSQLKSELRLIEKRQLEKFASPPSASLSTTNAVGAEQEKRAP